MNREEIYSLYEHHSTKTNRQLRKIFENSNWNYNIQLFRACEEIINDLKADYGNKAQVERDMLLIRIRDAIRYLKENSAESKVNFVGLPKVKIFKGDIEELLKILSGDIDEQN